MRLLSALILASSLTPRSLPERARIADRVVVAQVLSTRTEVPGGDVRKMLTHTEVVVGDVLKGPAGAALDRITITQLGGRSGLWESHVPGDATFRPGETALLLLKCSEAPNRCGLVGLAEGKVLFVGNDAFVYDLARDQYARRPVGLLLDEVRQAVTSTPVVPPARGVTR